MNFNKCFSRRVLLQVVHEAREREGEEQEVLAKKSIIQSLYLVHILPRFLRIPYNISLLQVVNQARQLEGKEPEPLLEKDQ